MTQQTLTRAAACLTMFPALAAAILCASLLAVGGSSVFAGARSPGASKLDLSVNAWIAPRTVSWGNLERANGDLVAK